MIYSESYAALPIEIRNHVETRLAKILLGEENSKGFEHLTRADCKAMLEILVETLPGFDDVVAREKKK